MVIRLSCLNAAGHTVLVVIDAYSLLRAYWILKSKRGEGRLHGYCTAKMAVQPIAFHQNAL